MSDKELVEALKSISKYIEKKKPTNFNDAVHMLDLISVIASESVKDAEDRASDPLAAF